MRSPKKKGQAVVEIALMLPLFLMLFLGIIDFGITLHIWSSLNNQCVQAVKTGSKRRLQMVARNAFTATTHETKANAEAAFEKYRSPLMGLENYFDVSYVGFEVATDTVSVRASYRVKFFTPFIGSMLGAASSNGQFAIHAMATARKE